MQTHDHKEHLLPEPESSIPSPFSLNGMLAWLTTVDHKMLGILYMVMALGYFLMAGLEALAIRIQLARPELNFVSPDTFNQLFTMHGTTMIFLALMPSLIGFATYFVPLMIGANEMAFPRLNAMSFWTTLFGGLLLYFSPFAGGAPDAGWFAYAPLSEKNYSFSPGLDYYCLGLMVTGIGSIGAALNFFVTVVTMRTKGMSYMRMPLFVWMVFINSVLMLGAFPLLNAGLAMLFLDRQFGAHFFLADQGGSALLWQHFFWAFGHPEVYILILPAFGIISEVIPVFSRKKIYGYPYLVFSAIAIMFFSLRSVGPPHVHRRYGPHREYLLRNREPFDCHPNRDQGHQLGGDHEGRVHPLPGSHAVRSSFSDRFYDWRFEWSHVRLATRRLAVDRHLLCGGSSSLRFPWWNNLRGLCWGLLLVSEDDRAHV